MKRTRLICYVTQVPFSTNLCAERMSPDMTVACGILHGSVSSSSISLTSLLPLLLTKDIFHSLPSPQTAEHLTLASLGKSPVEDPTLGNNNGEKGDRGKSTFHEDESLPVAFRAKLQDYFRSGYDRGHMYVPLLPVLRRVRDASSPLHLTLPLLAVKLCFCYARVPAADAKRSQVKRQ